MCKVKHLPFKICPLQTCQDICQDPSTLDHSVILSVTHSVYSQTTLNHSSPDSLEILLHPNPLSGHHRSLFFSVLQLACIYAQFDSLKPPCLVWAKGPAAEQSERERQNCYC